MPNDSENLKAIAAIQRRQGKWSESTANFEKATSLNPKDADLLLNFAFNYIALRRYDEAERIVDRGLQVAPDSFSLRGVKAQIALAARGDFSVAEDMLATVPAGLDPDGLISLARVNVWLLQRRFSEALQVVQHCPSEILHPNGIAPVPKAFSEGMIYLFMHENKKARDAFEGARPAAEQLLRESPEDPARHVLLAQLLVGLGDKKGGIAEADRAAELLPESRDAFDGPMVTIGQAQVLAWAGENDRALDLIRRSLSTPNGTTVPLLKIDPVWDPLRSDPRFQQLIEKPTGQPNEHG